MAQISDDELRAFHATLSALPSSERQRVLDYLNGKAGLVTPGDISKVQTNIKTMVAQVKRYQ
ncbi:hypothetical protein [Pseudomonas sp. NPDC086278]|uniref:hypothetical protein n=1 Tax=Pseudomonas sp. NPDC086278 TaxID=3390646 RepID=UPI003D063AD1